MKRLSKVTFTLVAFLLLTAMMPSRAYQIIKDVMNNARGKSVWIAHEMGPRSQYHHQEHLRLLMLGTRTIGGKAYNVLWNVVEGVRGAFVQILIIDAQVPANIKEILKNQGRLQHYMSLGSRPVGSPPSFSRTPLARSLGQYNGVLSRYILENASEKQAVIDLIQKKLKTILGRDIEILNNPGYIEDLADLGLRPQTNVVPSSRRLQLINHGDLNYGLLRNFDDDGARVYGRVLIGVSDDVSPEVMMRLEDVIREALNSVR